MDAAATLARENNVPVLFQLQIGAFSKVASKMEIYYNSVIEE